MTWRDQQAMARQFCVFWPILDGVQPPGPENLPWDDDELVHPQPRRPLGGGRRKNKENVVKKTPKTKQEDCKHRDDSLIHKETSKHFCCFRWVMSCLGEEQPDHYLVSADSGGDAGVGRLEARGHAATTCPTALCLCPLGQCVLTFSTEPFIFFFLFSKFTTLEASLRPPKAGRTPLQAQNPRADGLTFWLTAVAVVEH